MIVIARNNGPFYNFANGSRKRKGLKEGKSYDVIKCFCTYTKSEIIINNFLNPKEPKFFINVIDKDGSKSDFWNDYFLSNEEMREKKLNKLGICD